MDFMKFLLHWADSRRDDIKALKTKVSGILRCCCFK